MDHFDEDILLGYYAGELTTDQVAQVESFLPTCEACTDYLDELSHVGQALDLLDNEAESHNSFALVLDAIKAEQEIVISNPTRMSAVPYMYFAGAIIILFSVLYFVQGFIARLSLLQWITDLTPNLAMRSLEQAALMLLIIGIGITTAIAPLLIAKDVRQLPTNQRANLL